jgi:hypothetical protein
MCSSSHVLTGGSGKRVTRSRLSGMLAGILLAGLLIACADAPSSSTDRGTREPAKGQVLDVEPSDPSSGQTATMVSWSNQGEDRPTRLRTSRVWGQEAHCGDVSLLTSIRRVPLRMAPPWPHATPAETGSHGAIFGAP